MFFLMRIIFLSLFILCSAGLMAQPSLSLKVYPAFSSNRVETSSDTLRLTDDGSGLRFGVSLVADFPMTENYYFTTGISYIAKKSGLVVLNRNTSQVSKQVTNVRYVQIPVSLKLYTNELSLDTRFYFQIGALAEFKVGENDVEGNAEIIEDYGFFDTSLLFAAGAERKLGTTTAAYVGISYQRGLIDIINDTARIDGDLTMKNSLIGLEVGLRF